MGYTTEFIGRLTLTPQANPTQIEYINLFSETRRMGRKVSELMRVFKGDYGLPLIPSITPEQQAILDDLAKSGLNVSVKTVKQVDNRTPEEIYGKNGEFFVGNGNTGVIDNNKAPGQVSYDYKGVLDSYDENQRRIKSGECQPGLWCQWVLDKSGETLVWDGGEKFYNYVEWLQYMITNFFEPWGIKLNGEIAWEGEESSDIGKIVVTDNVIKTLRGVITYV